MLVLTFCAVCSETTGNTLMMTHISGFAVYKISSSSSDLLSVVITDRSLSCPSSVAVNSAWVVVGYSDEGAIDFYATNPSGNYSLQESFMYDEPVGFGAYVDCDESLVIVSGKGEVALNSYGSALIFELQSTSGFVVQQLQTSIPSLGYAVQFNYTFAVNLYMGTIFVVTQDRTLISWGFDSFDACPSGTGWSSDTAQCIPCPKGQHKETLEGSNFDLCTPCPDGSYSNELMNCANIPCPSGSFCPAGSAYPIVAITNYTIRSVPNPDASDPLDFENTFYYSCYPFFIIFLTGITAIAIPICCTWPNKTKAQKKLVKKLLAVNFYYDPTGKEEDFFMSDPPNSASTPLLNPINGEDDIDQVQKEEADARRRMHIDQFLGSLCSYFVFATIVLMIIFGVIFMAHGYNDSVVIDLQTVDESTSKDGTLAKYKALQELDTTPFNLQILLQGYNGNCDQSEVSLAVSGCYALDYQDNCAYNVSVNAGANGTDSSSCYVTVNIGPSNLDQQTTFTLLFSKSDFYAQQVQYNISTANDNTTKFEGNAHLFGAFQPEQGDILRGNVSVEILTILTFIGDCTSKSPKGYFMPSLVRVNEEFCVANNKSFKGLSFLSTNMDEVSANLFNHLNVSGFAYNVVLTKSPFYKNVYQTHFVSFGTIFNLTIFAALDVYWIVEVAVPFLGYVIFKLHKGLKLCK